MFWNSNEWRLSVSLTEIWEAKLSPSMVTLKLHEGETPMTESPLPEAIDEKSSGDETNEESHH